MHLPSIQINRPWRLRQSPLSRRFPSFSHLTSSPSLSTPPQSKPTNRKNHLRPKILKTLTKPSPIQTPSLPNTIPEDDPISLPPSAESLKVTDFLVTESSSNDPIGEFNGIVNKFSFKSVLKFSGYFVLVVLFQTVFLVWVLGDTRSNEKEKGFNELGSSELSNVGYFDDVEMRKKVDEIRVLARKAREEEKLKEGSEESGIELEVGTRIAKLEKRLSFKKERISEVLLNYLKDSFEDEIDEGDSLGSTKVSEKLMLEKKRRFRSGLVEGGSNAKGFSGLHEHKKSINEGVNGELKERNLESSESGGVRDNGTELASYRDDENKMEDRKIKKNEQTVASRENLNGESSQSLINGYHKTTDRVSGSNGRSGVKEKRKRPVAKKSANKNSGAQADVWWSKLPYVLAILMRRESVNEGEGGLYALKVASHTNDREITSYTLAFEDQVDADNFCCLLESFFEELGDFSADIVPLSTKEIREAMKSTMSKKVLVVKKGQIKLYIGQPFEEAEAALRSLITQQ